MIKAFIINRNLLSTVQNTVDFLSKEKRVEVWILDQGSTYQPLLDWYDTKPCNIFKFGENIGNHATWHQKAKHLHTNDHYIITDPDCIYDNIPNDWLDKLLDVMSKRKDVNKVGFSLEIEDLPNSPIGNMAKKHESQFWIKKCEEGWDADIDTTFCLYRRGSGFAYKAIRLDRPYTCKHVPWYLEKGKIDTEWQYYLDNASGISTWGSKIKSL